MGRRGYRQSATDAGEKRLRSQAGTVARSETSAATTSLRSRIPAEWEGRVLTVMMRTMFGCLRARASAAAGPALANSATAHPSSKPNLACMTDVLVAGHARSAGHAQACQACRLPPAACRLPPKHDPRVSHASRQACKACAKHGSWVSLPGLTCRLRSYRLLPPLTDGAFSASTRHEPGTRHSAGGGARPAR
jgi:hypothetical protein